MISLVLRKEILFHEWVGIHLEEMDDTMDQMEIQVDSKIFFHSLEGCETRVRDSILEIFLEVEQAGHEEKKRGMKSQKKKHRISMSPKRWKSHFSTFSTILPSP